MKVNPGDTLQVARALEVLKSLATICAYHDMRCICALYPNDGASVHGAGKFVVFSVLESMGYSLADIYHI